MSGRIHDILDDLPADVREAFEARARVRRYGPGETVYLQGDAGSSMFRILSGDVRVSVARPDGRELYYVYFGQHDCFGVSNFVDGLPRPQTAQAVNEVALQVLSGAEMGRLADEHPAFNRALMKLLSRHMRLLIDLLADANLDDLSERIARRIIEATPQGEDEAVAVNLSQTDIAHMVGASRQSVNKVMQRFQEEQLIRIEYGGLVVEAPGRLRQWAFPGRGLSAI